MLTEYTTPPAMGPVALPALLNEPGRLMILYQHL
jgi:hypothetical protein